MEEFSGTGGQLDFGIMAFFCFYFRTHKNKEKCVELTFIGSFAIKLRFIQSQRKKTSIDRCANEYIVFTS